MSTIDELFEVFCVDDQQRKKLQKQHGYEWQKQIIHFTKIKQVNELVNVWMLLLFPFSDKMFLRRHSQPEGPTCSFTEIAAASGSAFGYVSDCSSVHTE